MARSRDKLETISFECKCCEATFLAMPGTKEYERKICYRCHLSGMAEDYLNDESIEEISVVDTREKSS